MIRLDVKKRLRAAEGWMDLEVKAQFQKGQLIALYGPSGVGKTSLLRMLAGLLRPDVGQIEVHGSVWTDTDKRKFLPPQERKIGFVFQDYALFPNMTVRQNLEFAMTRKSDQSLVEELMNMTELEGLADRLPHSLSGGQKQRVALARSLVRQPELLLLDEPLSALDKTMRIKLQNYLKEVHQRYQLTTILVTHDLSEVFKLADQVLVLQNGQVIQQGKPEAVFGAPNVEGSIKFKAEIIGMQTLGHITHLDLLIGPNLLQQSFPVQQTKGLQIGDEIWITILEGKVGIEG